MHFVFQLLYGSFLTHNILILIIIFLHYCYYTMKMSLNLLFLKILFFKLSTVQFGLPITNWFHYGLTLCFLISTKLLHEFGAPTHRIGPISDKFSPLFQGKLSVSLHLVHRKYALKLLKLFQ